MQVPGAAGPLGLVRVVQSFPQTLDQVLSDCDCLMLFELPLANEFSC